DYNCPNGNVLLVSPKRYGAELSLAGRRSIERVCNPRHGEKQTLHIPHRPSAKLRSCGLAVLILQWKIQTVRSYEPDGYGSAAAHAFSGIENFTSGRRNSCARASWMGIAARLGFLGGSSVPPRVHGSGELYGEAVRTRRSAGCRSGSSDCAGDSVCGITIAPGGLGRTAGRGVCGGPRS